MLFRLPYLALTSAEVSPTLTTIALYDSSLKWFEAGGDTHRSLTQKEEHYGPLENSGGSYGLCRRVRWAPQETVTAETVLIGSQAAVKL